MWNPAGYHPIMLRRYRRLRTWTLLWAVLQFALPLGAAFVDADRAAASALAANAPHVEERSSETCHAPHALDCGICKQLSSSTPITASASHLAWRDLRTPQPFGSTSVLPAGPRDGPSRARAPPTPV